MKQEGQLGSKHLGHIRKVRSGNHAHGIKNWGSDTADVSICGRNPSGRVVQAASCNKGQHK
eukprot:11140157-Alexandrium_andersonii.AAC.1